MQVKAYTKIALVLAVLAGAAMLTSMRQTASLSGSKDSGACCPFMTALDSSTAAPASSYLSATNATGPEVIAYYFHGTVRCETCLLIERLAQTVIEEEFSAELAMNRLMFASVNYDLPENAHFLTDYKLPCPSLVLVKRRDDKDETWKLLSNTWQLIHEPAKFNAYVQAEVRTFLYGTNQHTKTNDSQYPSPQS